MGTRQPLGKTVVDRHQHACRDLRTPYIRRIRAESSEPRSSTLFIFTDGSRRNPGEDWTEPRAGFGVVVFYQGAEIAQQARALGATANIYDAEMAAFIQYHPSPPSTPPAHMLPNVIPSTSSKLPTTSSRSIEICTLKSDGAPVTPESLGMNEQMHSHELAQPFLYTQTSANHTRSHNNKWETRKQPSLRGNNAGTHRPAAAKPT
ncbi:hypothetical protein BC834DRAFT_910666 [Gloeopeniophorella convolvens]|nr:hypothetical protein BC834DRAFT_910666 [Gloeopeniophorella convolvens]